MFIIHGGREFYDEYTSYDVSEKLYTNYDKGLKVLKDLYDGYINDLKDCLDDTEDFDAAFETEFDTNNVDYAWFEIKDAEGYRAYYELTNIEVDND